MEGKGGVESFLDGLRMRAAAVGELIEADRKKLCGMTLGSTVRLGLSELREAVSLESRIAQPTPYGMWGTLTPGEVAAGRDPDSLATTMDQETWMTSLPSPSEIAEDRGPYGRDGAHAALYGEQTQSKTVQPTPGDIADDHTPDALEHDRGREHGISRKR
jgi:hypothetical protein